MNDQLTFYYNPMSRGRIAHWMLEEVGADYQVHLIDWATREQKSPDFLRINPMGKLPAIVHKGVTVTETAAICLYLADAFPAKALAPEAHDPMRGSYYRWMFFTVNCVEAAMADKANPRTKETTPSQLGYGSYEDTMNVLREAVSKDYLLGGKFTTPDLYLSSVLGWYMMQKILEPDPVLSSYVARCSERASYRRFTEKAQALMK